MVNAPMELLLEVIPVKVRNLSNVLIKLSWNSACVARCK